jgi:hypothetical protein
VLWCGLLTASLVGFFMKWDGRETGPKLSERSQDCGRPFSSLAGLCQSRFQGD